jgi:hypothetical protein
MQAILSTDCTTVRLVIPGKENSTTLKVTYEGEENGLANFSYIDASQMDMSMRRNSILKNRISSNLANNAQNAASPPTETSFE